MDMDGFISFHISNRTLMISVLQRVVRVHAPKEKKGNEKDT